MSFSLRQTASSRASPPPPQPTCVLAGDEHAEKVGNRSMLMQQVRPPAERTLELIYNLTMITFIEYVENWGRRVNGKCVGTTRTKPVCPCVGLRFPDALNILSVLNISMFEPSDEDLQRWLDRADRHPTSPPGTTTLTSGWGCSGRGG
jgi:hypothetical protein